MAAGIVFLLPAHAGAREPPLEAPIIYGAIPLEEPGRYRLRTSYEQTIDYYERKFRRTRGIRWHNIVNLPGIKAKHIACLAKKTDWEGINIYETRGQVRLFVISRVKKPPKENRSGKARPP